MTPPGNVSTWPMQASFASKGDWQGLMELNEKQRAAAKPAAARTEANRRGSARRPDPDQRHRSANSTILNEGGITTYAELQRRTPVSCARSSRSVEHAALEPRELADTGLLRGAR